MKYSQQEAEPQAYAFPSRQQNAGAMLCGADNPLKEKLGAGKNSEIIHATFKT
jgi:hypothetical protein